MKNIQNYLSKNKEIVLATHNQGKVIEISAMLKPYGVNVVSAIDLDLPDPEETGATFEENAILKAKVGAEASGKVVLADDSGLSVLALNGDPGIYSARWAGEKKDFKMAMKKVNDALGNNADRRAAFIGVLAVASPDGEIVTFEGRVEGEIVWPPRGKDGFGYDQIFQPFGENRTFAEMSAEEKKSMSHRGKAVEEMIEKIF